MIELHRLGHADQRFHLNPDLVVTVESHPDNAVITLSTGAKVVVAESADAVVEAIRSFRVDLMSAALRGRRATLIRSDEPIPLR